MKRISLFVASLAMMVAGCATPPLSNGTAPASTTVGDVLVNLAVSQTKVGAALATVQSVAGSSQAQAVIRDAWDTFDVALSGIDVLVATHQLVRNSPKALAVRSAVKRTTSFLQAASAAQRAGANATNISSALSNARDAIADVIAALK